uniref:WD repeat domain 41 n=1 Tax=Cricetulus griseus TaxID=10029 RepID=A0A8C2LLR1_CRIGR
MLRWLIGGGREPQGLAEKAALQTIGEDQSQNPYTELLVLKAHRDIVRFLVQLDDNRFASAGDDGIIIVWNAQTGEKLLELRGHTQKITAVIAFPSLDSCEVDSQLILTASADRTVVWDCDTGRQIQRVSCFQSTVKCLTVLQGLDIWLSGGNDLGVWNRKLDLLCKTDHLSDTGISALVEIPRNCVVAAVGKELIIFRLVAPTEGLLEWDIIEVKRLLDHQDNILSLVNINGKLFVYIYGSLHSFHSFACSVLTGCFNSVMTTDPDLQSMSVLFILKLFDSFGVE